MERLTYRTNMGIVGNNESVKNYPLYKVAEYDELDHGIVSQCFEKLADYEDAEEQGLLLRLPCKVGDIVYIISRNNEIIPLNVYGIDIREDDFTLLVKNEKYSGYSMLSLLSKYKSVDWFITQAEAEQKLKEMESD